jgi:membrane-bound lytic murein transglycosylase B
MTATRRVAVVTAWVAVLGIATGMTFMAMAVLHDPEPVLRYDPTGLAATVPAARHDGAGGARTVESPAVDPGWLRRTAAETGLPELAVKAYATATLRLSGEQPGCHLGWSTLAGIAEVESVHGTLDGRTLLADGQPSQPIIGPALDGHGRVAAIRATGSATALHGDPTWDHAVGPFQFLPATWARWGGDVDGDGVADPQDLDDAAYAAGRYLCASGGDLGDGRAWAAAVFSYNHASAYVAAVYAAAVRFSG